MQKLLNICFVCLTVLVLSSVTSAADPFKFVIDGTGLQYYSLSDVDSETTELRALTCLETSKFLRNSSGGRGQVVEECSSHRVPRVRYKVKTFELNNWSTCEILSRENSFVYLSCPKIFLSN